MPIASPLALHSGLKGLSWTNIYSDRASEFREIRWNSPISFPVLALRNTAERSRQITVNGSGKNGERAKLAKDDRNHGLNVNCAGVRVWEWVGARSSHQRARSNPWTCTFNDKASSCTSKALGKGGDAIVINSVEAIVTWLSLFNCESACSVSFPELAYQRKARTQRQLNRPKSQQVQEFHSNLCACFCLYWEVFRYLRRFVRLSCISKHSSIILAGILIVLCIMSHADKMTGGTISISTNWFVRSVRGWEAIWHKFWDR